MITPDFKITAALIKLLKEIEACHQALSSLPMTLQQLTALRESARQMSTHYSTRLSGNRLSVLQVATVLQDGQLMNRTREANEIKNYDCAREFMDSLISSRSAPLQLQTIQTLHGLMTEGKRQISALRDSQSVLIDRASLALGQTSPDTQDITELMSNLVCWINQQIQQPRLPIPLIAAITHYQLIAIRPFDDGNGRIARLLTHWVIHKCGYGLKGIYTLEAYFAKNPQAYRQALSTPYPINHQFGRANTDLSRWMMYFCQGMAYTFAAIQLPTTSLKKTLPSLKPTPTPTPTTIDPSKLLRKLDPKQRLVLPLFQHSQYITCRDLADLLQVHKRTALNFFHRWAEEGFIISHGIGNKNRKYELAATWAELL